MQRSSTRVASSDSSVTYIKTLVKERTPEDLERYKMEKVIDDHLISLQELQSRYHTDIKDGLSRAKAAELLLTNGPNCLIPPPGKSKLKLFAACLFGGLEGLLWIGAILSILGYCLQYYHDHDTPYDAVYVAISLFASIFITATVGFYQESSSSAIMESFKKLIPKSAVVIRDGQKMEIPAEEIVIGDLVEVHAGDSVPADLRIITCTGLKVDNSSITGESEVQQRSPKPSDKNPLETTNLAFFSTNVMEGTGTGIVIACGDDTIIGHIAGLTSGIESDDTPIKKEIKHFTKLISLVAVTIGTFIFITSLKVGYSIPAAFALFVTITVANVPEGLTLTLTLCLTLTAKRMLRRHCLVKNLQAIETLGSTSVICSDKTGTLTQNQMTVAHIYFSDVAYSILGDHISFPRTETFNSLCRVGILCSKASFAADQERVAIQNRKVVGDPSEAAVLKCMEQLVGKVMDKRNEFPKLEAVSYKAKKSQTFSKEQVESFIRFAPDDEHLLRKVCEIPFNSVNKYQLSIHSSKEINGYLLVMKGAPERIIEICSTYLHNDSEINLDPGRKKDLQRAVLKLGYMGERVLGFADLLLPSSSYPANYKFYTDNPNFPLKGLRFVGLMSMLDPPRNSVPEAVETCRSAGIQIVMVTGDHPITAVAIAKKVGIISPNNETLYDVAMRTNVSAGNILSKDLKPSAACVITGSDLREMNQFDLDRIVNTFSEIVFARTSPQQKLQIVEAFQRRGAIVAVTGDGVNDSPALKKADIGVAMGISGSDVSKQAADMIILDDNFASIVKGIEEGRLIFDNLKKSIVFTLTCNTPEITPFILFATINIPSALSIMGVLVINMGTDLWPAISLAYERAESDIMHRKPRNPNKDKLVNNQLLFMGYLQIGIIQVFAAFATYFFVMAQCGFYYDRLIGIREEWNSEYVNDLVDSYGQEWTYDERKVLEKKGYSAYFLSIIITQIADSIICKTRRLSIVQQGMSNWTLNFGLVFQIGLGYLCIYTPGLNTVLRFEPIPWYTFIPTIPFVIFMFVYDELRRLCIRLYPNGWVYKETYY